MMKLKILIILLVLIFIFNCAYVKFNPKTQNFTYCNWKKLEVNIDYKNPITGEQFKGSLTSDPSPWIELTKYAIDQYAKGFEAGKTTIK